MSGARETRQARLASQRGWRNTARMETYDQLDVNTELMPASRPVAR